MSSTQRYLRLLTTAAFTGGTSPAAIVAADFVVGGIQEILAA